MTDCNSIRNDLEGQRRSLFSAFVLTLAVLFLFLGTVPVRGDENQQIILIVGAAGEKQYGEMFSTWAKRIQKHAAENKTPITTIGLAPLDASNKKSKDRDLVQLAIQNAAKKSPSELWLIIIGHGTFDGKSAKLNLRGPDCTASEIGKWLQPIKSKTIIVNCGSTSGVFVNKLSAKNRIIITSTKSGYQYNFSRFGDYFSQSLTDKTIDLDKDGGVSLLEVFLASSKRTAEYYSAKSQLATEHALLDDNGDSLGTPADWFSGVRVVKKSKDPKLLPDGFRANQVFLIPNKRDSNLSAEAIKKRNDLELKLERLRAQKSVMIEDEYYQRLETLMFELAKIYESADRD